MRQTSEGFMGKMLEDNTPAPEGEDLSEKIANIIDKKMAESMEKFKAELEKVSPPADVVETPDEKSKETEDQITRPEENLVNETIDNVIENK